MAYAEITAEAFIAIEHHLKRVRTERREMAVIEDFVGLGINVRVVFNFISAVHQYYILDINS